MSFPLNKPMTQCQFQRECTRQWEMAAFRMSILGLKIHPMLGEGDPAWLALTLTNTSLEQDKIKLQKKEPTESVTYVI